MRFYQYKATDQHGQPAQGTIRAESIDAAKAALASAGYRVASVLDPAAASAPVPAAVGASKVAARPMSPPVSRVAEAPRPMVVNTIAQTARPLDEIKTRQSKDKDVFFLFTQLAQYYRAGITMHTAMGDLVHKVAPILRDSVTEAQKALMEGGRISQVFARYPYLYSPDVIGALKAGELSGHMADVCEKIADQKMTSWAIHRKLYVNVITLCSLVGGFPILYSIMNGSLKSILDQDKSNGQLPVIPTLLKGIGTIFYLNLPWIIPVLVAFFGFIAYWQTMKMRPKRHQLALLFPILGPRAKVESMARFSWTMGLVSKGGVAPQETFRIAAESVPNLTVRDQLLAAAAGMHESERLSTALHRSGVVPIEYAHIVETGELTGDVPRALDDIARATDADFRGRDITAAVATQRIFLCLLAIVVVIVLGVLYRGFYGGLITGLTQDS